MAFVLILPDNLLYNLCKNSRFTGCPFRSHMSHVAPLCRYYWKHGFFNGLSFNGQWKAFIVLVAWSPINNNFSCYLCTCVCDWTVNTRRPKTVVAASWITWKWWIWTTQNRYSVSISFKQKSEAKENKDGIRAAVCC